LESAFICVYLRFNCRIQVQADLARCPLTIRLERQETKLCGRGRPRSDQFSPFKSEPLGLADLAVLLGKMSKVLTGRLAGRAGWRPVPPAKKRDN